MNGLPSVNPHLIAVMEINSIPLTLPGGSRDTRARVQGGEGWVPSRRPLRVCVHTQCDNSKAVHTTDFWQC